MSLWLQNLEWGLDDAKTPEERARCILGCLSMTVPRQWWENSIKYGKIQGTQKDLLRQFYSELIEFPELKDRIDFYLLIALAFADNYNITLSSSGRFIDSLFSIDQYIDIARGALERHPEIIELVNKSGFEI